MADDGDEDYVFFGTPILREEELSTRKKKSALNSGHVRRLPPWKQEVTDEEGRRRFHGAFTGGFSAGYYNTVGSKEGWTPQMFTSSRKKRADVRSQSIYNFLDDDEKMEYEAKEVSTSSQFDTFGFTAAEMARKQAEKDVQQRPSAIPGPVPDEIVVPVTESIGTKLLKQMGWRQGRMVGAKYLSSVSEFRRDARKAFLAFATEPKDSSENTPELHSESAENEGATNTDTDPRNVPSSTPIFVLQPKNDVYGLGYDPYKGAPEFRERKDKRESQVKMGEQRKLDRARGSLFRPNAGKTASGFGIGALEDIDEDDEDIYASSLDFSLASEELEEKSSKKDQLKKEKRLLRDELPRFTEASISSCHTEWFVPPIVPSGFVPHHKFSTELKEEQKLCDLPPLEVEPPTDMDLRVMIDGVANIVAKSGKLLEDLYKEKHPNNPMFAFLFGGSGHDYYRRKLWEAQNRLAKEGKITTDIPSEMKNKKLNAEERGRILGETPLERVPDKDKKSVPQFDVNRLQSILSDTFTKPFPVVEDVAIGKPFQNDPAKQARFEQFLKDKYQGGLRSTSIGNDGRSELERAQERLDFEGAAAAIEKHVQSSRTSESAKQHIDLLTVGGNRFTSGGIETFETKSRQNSNQVEVLKENRTVPVREEHSWRPSALLCKRFHLIDPYAGKPPPVPTVKSKMDSLILISNPVRDTIETSSPLKDSSSQFEKTDSMLESPKSDEEEKEETGETKDGVVKKHVDLYKAIFSDDSDSEADESTEKEFDAKEQRAEGANAVLNRLIAGDFLESLGKEMGLKVPSQLERIQKEEGTTSTVKESSNTAGINHPATDKSASLQNVSSTKESPRCYINKVSLHKEGKTPSAASLNAATMKGYNSKERSMPLSEVRKTDGLGHSSPTGHKYHIPDQEEEKVKKLDRKERYESDPHNYALSERERDKDEKAVKKHKHERDANKYGSSYQNSSEDNELKRKQRKESSHYEWSSRRHHKRKHKSSKHDSLRKKRERERGDSRRKHRKKHRRNSPSSPSSSSSYESD